MEGVFPQVVFSVMGVPVRDTVVSTWVMMVLTVAVVLLVRRLKPTAVELLVDFLDDMISQVMGRDAAPYLPFLGAIAIFIAVSNIMGAVPVVVNPTSDVNTPIALALVVFLSVHYFGVASHGFLTYLKDLATPIYVFPLELVGQVSRTVSLALRLFGNIVSTKLVVAVVFALVPLFVPIPLIGFSLFTGFLQAYIFTALATVYIGAALMEQAPDLSEQQGGN